jgi:hypothetical protein
VPETKYSRDTQRLDFIGIDLNRPVDSVKPSKMPYAKNARSFVAGRIECRDGLTQVLQGQAGQFPAHSIRRLNDTANNTYARVAGVATHLQVGQNALVDTDPNYSGNPLALVPWKPIASPRSFMYVGDSAKMSKVSALGDLHPIGLPAPAVAPGVALSPNPVSLIVDLFDTTNSQGFGTWTLNPTGGTPPLSALDTSRTPTQTTLTGTTIANIVYDSGTTGWASVQLTIQTVGTAGIPNELGRGQMLYFGAPTNERAMVQDVFPGMLTPVTSIAQIIYDSGTNGPCSIALTTPVEHLSVGSMLELQGGTISAPTAPAEFVTVQGLQPAPDGTYSIRTSTVNTFIPGNSIILLPSIRIFLKNHYATGQAVFSNAVSFVMPVGTNVFTKSVSMDLSQLAPGVPTQPDDWMSIGINVANPENIKFIRIQLDVDVQDGNPTGLTKNYYYREIRP